MADNEQEIFTEMMKYLDVLNNTLRVANHIESLSFDTLTQEDWHLVRASMPMLRALCETQKRAVSVSTSVFDNKELLDQIVKAIDNNEGGS